MFLHTRVLVIIQPSVAIKPLFFNALKHFVKKFPQAPENWSYARDVLWSYAEDVCQECMKTAIALKFFGCREKRIKYLSF